MIITFLCPPALLYAVIMLIYLILELSNKKYKEALVKAIIGIIFTCILQAFCQMSLGLVSEFLTHLKSLFLVYPFLHDLIYLHVLGFNSFPIAHSGVVIILL